MTVEPTPPPEPRLDSRRQGAVDELLKAFGEGRMSFDSYCERVDAVRDAATEAELEQALDGVRRDVAAAPVGAVADGRTSTLFSLFGDVERTGSWSASSNTQIYGLFGDATIDLRDAYLEPGDVTITAWNLFGDLRVLVPDGVQVINEGFTLFGDLRTDVHGDRIPNAPRVIVRYYALFGDSRVASESSGERWFARWRKRRERRQR